jgi:outer membrane protein OmpA-like peptidoglycan-associated protein
MVRYHSGAPRFGKRWLGLLLGGSCVVVGAGGAAAISGTTRPLLPRPMLVQDRLATAPVEPTAGAESSPLTELQEALAAARERLEVLSKAAAVMAAAGELRDELIALREDNRRLVAAASGIGTAAEKHLAGMRGRLVQAEQNAAQADDRLAVVQGQLDAARKLALAAQRDRAAAEQRLAALVSEREQLRDQLATVSAQLEQTAAANDRLESQMAKLRAAASTATDAAHQKLVAVAQQVRAALGTIAPTADRVTSAPPPAFAAAEERDPQAAVLGEQDRGLTASETAASQADVDLTVTKVAVAPNPTVGADKSNMLAAPSPKQRLHVQGLAADLDATVDERRLKIVLPGGVFAVNSDEVHESAQDTLAKIAELIKIYGDREVRIIGHTDSLGDTAYNKQLSERRAGMVKQFLVKNFDVEEVRLSTEGLGAASPIASNVTPEGRRANRRVEVLILN